MMKRIWKVKRMSWGERQLRFLKECRSRITRSICPGRKRAAHKRIGRSRGRLYKWSGHPAGERLASERFECQGYGSPTRIFAGRLLAGVSIGIRGELPTLRNRHLSLEKEAQKLKRNTRPMPPPILIIPSDHRQTPTGLQERTLFAPSRRRSLRARSIAVIQSLPM